jgi:predicted DNA-binding transcriptional regulator YafY
MINAAQIDSAQSEHAHDPTARTLALLSLLQTHRHWKGSELAKHLRVSERTVRRDVDRLRGLGYPVDAGPGVDGGYRLAVGAHIPPLLLDDDEAVALIVGLRTTAVAAIEGIEDTSLRLMAKVDQMLPDRVRRRVDALHGSVDVLSWSPVVETIPPATLTMLAQGCRDREEVRFDYRRRDGEESRRLVRPLHLVSAGRRWYLVAWDVRRTDWRTFRVDRIDQPKLGGARFAPLALPAQDPASFVAEGLRSRATEFLATVVIDGSSEEIAAKMRWFDAVAEDVGLGQTRIGLRAESLDWLASMIAILALSFDVVIVEAPDGTRERLARTATRLGRC